LQKRWSKANRKKWKVSRERIQALLTNSEPRTKSRTLYRLSKAGEEENNRK
jgi:hypothetical protein